MKRLDPGRSSVHSCAVSKTHATETEQPKAPFAHAQPVPITKFRLAEDGTIVFPEAQPKTEAVSEADLPTMVYAQPDRKVWLYRANCLSFLDALYEQYGDEGYFDVVFADPPYFLSNGGITCHAGRMVKVDKGDWDKSMGFELNHEFTMQWLKRCQRLLKPNGTLWVTGTQHIIFSAGAAMQELGFKILNVITWEKPNPPPNLSCRYFTHSTELVIWAAKNARSRHVFNYRAMREANGGKQMKSVWRIKSPSKEEKRFGKHPAQKPLALVERCLLASSRPGDRVLDPFAGIGTTAVAALRQDRVSIGIDLDRRWLQAGAERIEAELARRKRETAPLNLKSPGT